MNKPHKHAEVIKAWADGKTVQWRRNWGLYPTDWADWDSKSGPGFDSAVIFRIKPELKDPALVLKEAWYKSLLGRDTEDGNMREWTAAAKALIQAYEAGELKDI